ncbi:alpha/beta hydrolase fold domain-containing protein [Massariosphaeria phaeospora]|uniref:Alpha/beta hydrolase fold domain-containing protein n=1 Tax=Massariosphaeria phaeospora TaxID=100035 RepID=A0A7C8ML18_9PLEO|nr:alpha/beta hydrolase fold domain-containing protein [Massariosphaeria phaeospora]
MQENESITLADGRTLAYGIYGSPTSERTVFFFHAFPSARVEGRIWHSAAAKLNIRFIVPDRPGMGYSTYQPNRTLLDWPADVLALADHLKIQQFYVMGLSGGGPYTFACVKSIPKNRLSGAAVVSGLYPVKLGTAGMLMKGRVILWIGPWIPGLLGSLVDSMLGTAARNPDPKVLEAAMKKELATRTEIDQRAMIDERNWPAFVESTREGLRQGGQGLGWDTKLFGDPWGFDLEELDADIPVTMWHGTEDVNTPLQMAQKAKAKLPTATLHTLEGEGHVSHAFFHQEDILRELVGV